VMLGLTVAVGMAVVVMVGMAEGLPGVVRLALPLDVAVTGTTAPVAGAATLRGAVAAPRVGGRIGVLLCRGHRPIIARTVGALCSPRPN
jgi:hypothetical protein